MKYTVIVPVYNGEDTIAECLRSLINQEGVVLEKDYTIMVVDDGSTDNTLKIVRGFPVRILQLPENRGRIIARLSGAGAAATERILFVDSRISLSADTIGRLDEFAGYPAVIGEVQAEETKYDSLIHTVLYLIRRRYYGTENFPMRSDELLITEANFKRSPKGTALLLIDRNLFIELTPERTGKDVSDDTLLFHNLVFKHKVNLLRSRKLFFKYSLRSDLRQFSSWLCHRGVLFSDFYLRPGGYFFLPFILFSAIGAVAIITTAALMFQSPAGALIPLTVACLLNAALSVHLAEKPIDIPRAFVALPVVVTIFSSGVAVFWIRMLKSLITAGRKTF